MKTIRYETRVQDVHIVWAFASHWNAMHHDNVPGPLHSLLCHFGLFKVSRWRPPRDFPLVTHLMLLDLGTRELALCERENFSSLTYFACTIYKPFWPSTDIEDLLLPRLRDIFERPTSELPPLRAARLFVAKELLREGEEEIRRLAHVSGTDVRFVELPDVMDEASRHTLARGLSQAHSNGSLWESRVISYDEILQYSSTAQ